MTSRRPARNASHPIALTDDVPSLTVAQLGQQMAGMGGTPYELLAALAFAATSIPPMARAGRIPESADALGALMVVCLQTQVVEPPESLGQGRPLLPSALNELCHLAYAVKSEHEKAVDPGLTARERTLRDLPRVLGLQGVLDCDPMSAAGRFALLTGGASDAALSLEHSAALASVVEAEFGVPIQRLAAVAFAGWVVASRSAIFQLDQIFERFPNRDLTEASFREFLGRASITIADAKASLLSDLRTLPPMAQAFDLFTRYPFIDLGRGWFMASPHPYTRYFMSHRLFYATRAAARSQLGGSKHGPDDNAVSTMLGRRFEQYCRHIVGLACPTFDCYDEHKFEIKSDSKAPEGVLLDEQGKECILLQAKLRMPTRGFLLAEPGAKLAEDVETVYARMIDQTCRYLIALDVAQRKGKLRPETRAISDRVLAARRWTFLCLCPSVPQVAHLPQFGRQLKQALAKLMKPEVFAWYSEMRNRGRIAMVHVDQVEPLEYYAANKAHCSLPSNLRTWRAAADAAARTTLTHGAEPSLPASFSNYMRMGRGARRATRLPLLRRAYHAALGDMSNILGPIEGFGGAEGEPQLQGGDSA